MLTSGTAILEPGLGVAKGRTGARLNSAATAAEGTQNLLCAYLALAAFAGLLANTVFGAWWLDGAVAQAIAGWALREGLRAWNGPPARVPASEKRGADRCPGVAARARSAAR